MSTSAFLKILEVTEACGPGSSPGRPEPRRDAAEMRPQTHHRRTPGRRSSLAGLGDKSTPCSPQPVTAMGGKKKQKKKQNYFGRNGRESACTHASTGVARYFVDAPCVPAAVCGQAGRRVQVSPESPAGPLDGGRCSLVCGGQVLRGLLVGARGRNHGDPGGGLSGSGPTRLTGRRWTHLVLPQHLPDGRWKLEAPALHLGFPGH